MRQLMMVSLVLAALALGPRSTLAHEETTIPSAASAGASVEVRSAAHASTRRVLDLHATYRRASDTESKSAAFRDLVTAAASRQKRLASLIEQHPADVIQAAIPASVRATLPAELQRYVEEDVTVEGDVDVLHEDNDTGGRYVHWLRVAAARLSVHFTDRPPVLQSGARVRIRAVRVQEALAVGGSEAVTVLAAAQPLPRSFGSQNTAVFLVAFQDQPTVTSSTVAAAQNVMFDASHSVSNFFRESSYQQTWLTGDVFGPYVVPYNRGSGCPHWGIAQAAEEAAKREGVALASYKRRVYAFPYSSGCSWGGLGQLGGSPSKAWINGRSAVYDGLHPGTVAHELGHNFGLYHSHALDCGTVAIGGACSSIEYGDTLDVMGAGQLDHFNAPQKERLGWLNWDQSPPITDVTTTGIYTIDPYETLSANPKALKISLPSGDTFYVEYRRQVSNNVNVSNGVVIHFVAHGSASSIYLLDMTPATSSWWDPALAVGQSFNDAAAGVNITPVWVNDTSAGVNVTLGGAASSCVRQNPTETITPAQQQGGAGVSRTYTIAVTNNDTGCAASSFSLQATVPSGWTGLLGSPVLSINPSATVSTTLTVRPPLSVSPGTYTIPVHAANTSAPSYAVSPSAVYVVGSGGAGTFTDDFNRADADDLGAGWTKVSGALMIQGNQLRTSTARALHTAIVPGLSGATQRASARFSMAENSGGPRFGVIVRYQDPNNYYSCYRQAGGASVFRIVKVVNGVEQVLKSSPVANPASNVFWTIGCRAENSTLTLDFNGATRISVSDSSFSTGKEGLQMGYGATVGRSVSLRADDFSATAP